jgi:hypothetical protein
MPAVDFVTVDTAKAGRSNTCTLGAPAVRVVTSPRVSAATSKLRSPVCMVRASIAWSSRPVQVR